MPILSSNNLKVVWIHCRNSQSPEFTKGSYIKFINDNINNKCEKNKKTKRKRKKKKNIEINIKKITIKYKMDHNNKNKIFQKDFVLNNKKR